MHDYHSIFYYMLLAPLQNLLGGSGKLSDQYRAKKGTPIFNIGYEPRASHYQHTYMRDDFIANRNKLVLASRNEGDDYSDSVILLKESRDGESVTLYRRAVRYIFEEEEAYQELKKLLDKFYNVTEQDVCEHNAVDFSKSRSPSQVRIRYDI